MQMGKETAKWLKKAEHDLVTAQVNLDGECDALNPHYIETRYPVESYHDEEVAAEAIANAGAVVKWVKEKLMK